MQTKTTVVSRPDPRDANRHGFLTPYVLREENFRKFFTRTKVPTAGGWQYQYSAKPKHKDIVRRAQYAAEHGKYPTL